MLFNSYPFIFCFLPITLIGFFCLNKWRFARLAQIWLIIASIAFYSYWSIAYLPLLLISIVVNYQVGKRISDNRLGSRQAQTLLWIGVSFNFGLLAYYKYSNFVVNTIDKAFNTNWNLPEIILPLGISFYTFTQTAYLVDAYRGETKNYNFWNYSLFVTFFPHLIAGPILHHSDTIPQFYRLRNLVFSHINMAIGLTWFVLGLYKKVIIADTVAPWVSPVFNHADAVSFVEAWAGALSYTIQLYFDFSGYSDMAVGLGFMLNIQLPINFNSPYKATSITDFWRRWHITLSNFLRDYLYIPLGGNRRGEIRRYTNLLLTMLLGGLWHGAGWTFITWGGLHGMYLCINHSWRKLNKPLPKFIAWPITFIAVTVSWVIFRSHNISDALQLIKTMAGIKGIALTEGYQTSWQWLSEFGVKFQRSYPYLPTKESLVILIGLILWVLFLPNTQQIVQWFRPKSWWAIGLSIMAIYSLLSLNKVSEFLYFQF
jgi:alginate O-acetyltransferase complex protein AlgI